MPTDKQRREAQRRKLQRQMERRREQAVKRRRNNVIGSVIGALVLVAVIVFVVVETTGDSSTPAANPKTSATAPTSPATTPATSPAASPTIIKRNFTGTCSFPKSATAAARKVNLPAAKESNKGTVQIAVHTNRGDMTFLLDRATAPCTVASFVSLVNQKYFNNTPCPRVESTNLFILQCGDPTGTGTGGPGYTVPDEYTGVEKYTAGTLAMANTGAPNSGGSQFFIVYKDDPLPPSYTIFGKVTTGLNVVTTVAAGGNDGSNSAGGGHPKLAINLLTLTAKA